MTEERCPVKDCSDDCKQCNGLPPFEECVYVVLYRGIKSGEFQRDKSRPWEEIKREIQSSASEGMSK